MKLPSSSLPLLCLGLSLSMAPLHAGPVIISDNFNAPDTANFDTSVQTGRRGGLLANSIQLRSSRIQHGISDTQLNILRHPTSGDGRIRFHDANVLANWWDFASGATGAQIAADGGFRIAFDWMPVENTSANWISFSVGFPGLAALAEPATRINQAQTDFGMLLRNNGGVQYFDNGPSIADRPAGTFNVSAIVPRHVVIDCAFSSFADGETATINASVDGVNVVNNYAFQWNNNLGVCYIELGNFVTGTKLDNFSLSTLALDGLLTKADKLSFLSSSPNGGVVANLSSTFEGLEEPSTYTLVAGAGDTDNGKFKITDNRLETNGFNFTGLAHGTPLSVRIQSVGSVPARTTTTTIALTIIADADSDQLPDPWETARAGNLTDLKGNAAGAGPGAGSGNFDGDTLTDYEEYVIATSGYAPYYPTLSPLLADTDGDGLEDGSEFTGAGLRGPTNPILADTDKDRLSDGVESNTRIAGGAGDTGTDPLNWDTDGDVNPDSFEVANGSDPLNSNSLPIRSAPFRVTLLTDDETSGISPDNNYTHTISGGYTTTVNGVTFSKLGVGAVPGSFTWVSTGIFSEIATPTLGSWLPNNGSVSGTGLRDLLGGFSYSGTADSPGGKQTFTLSGLTPGETYDLRLYVRMWASGATGRPTEFNFINGATTVSTFLPMDRPHFVAGVNNSQDGYYLNFHYTAAAATLVMEALVPPYAPLASGSLHLYGLTNEVSTATDFSISDVVYSATPTPRVTLTFPSTPGKTYAIDYSTDLKATGLPGGWIELITAVPAEAGSTTSYTDTTIAGTLPRVLYRVRRLP